MSDMIEEVSEASLSRMSHKELYDLANRTHFLFQQTTSPTELVSVKFFVTEVSKETAERMRIIYAEIKRRGRFFLGFVELLWAVPLVGDEPIYF